MQLYNIVFPWVIWIEFALLVLLFIVSAMQPHAIVQGIQTITAPIQRRYTDGGNRVVTFLQMLFQVGTLALTALLSMQALLPSHPNITGVQYGYMMLIVVVISLLKNGLDRYLHTTFQYAVHAPTYYNHRNTIWQLACILLFICLLVSPCLPTCACWIIPAGVGVVYVGITQWKLITLFGLSIDHLVYITLYMLHAEIVPVLLMLAGAYQLLTYTI